MRRAVCIVSPGNLASNPRVLKEADALHGAGYDVTSVFCGYSDALRAADDEIAAAVPWKTVRVPRSPIEGVRLRAVRPFARTAQAVGWTMPPGLAAEAYGGPVATLTRHVCEIRADLYIAHYVSALPAAAAAARRHGGLLGFDAEDFHSGEGTGLPDDAFRMRMVEAVESAILPSCVHLTAAAPMIGEAYAARYGIDVPRTLLNVFPLSMAPAERTRRSGDGLRAYWFSQTIGLDRGLQAFIEAMALTRVPVTLDIRGSNRWGHGDTLLALARSLGIEGRVRLQPMAPPSEMARLAAECDIGLSLETEISENRRLCLTNKIFTYLLAGMPVIMSDTPAQRRLAPDLGEAARLVSLADPAGTAQMLDALAAPPAFDAASASAWRLGRERYNWEHEQAGLLEGVAAAFAAKGTS
ncbi:MAG: glycosyltransferase [Reyranella sp.]|nr:MAG: glycosyltransferase [Reyranella sp.]